MKTNDDRQHLTQAQLRLAVTLFWGPCQQVLLPARLKELAKVVNGAKNRYSIHRNLPLLTKVCLLYPLHILGYAGSFFTSLTSNSRWLSWQNSACRFQSRWCWTMLAINGVRWSSPS